MNLHGGYLATQLMIENGHKQIAYISGPQLKHDAQASLLGHKRALKEHNIPFEEELYYEGEFTETGGINGLKCFIAQKPHLQHSFVQMMKWRLVQ